MPALLLTHARALQRCRAAGQGNSLLRGKNLGLLCEADDDEDALRFRRAATDLGARVAHVRPEPLGGQLARGVADTGRMLGRLYDGIECLGLDAALVKRLGAAANVPVYDGIASRRSSDGQAGRAARRAHPSTRPSLHGPGDPAEHAQLIFGSTLENPMFQPHSRSRRWQRRRRVRA